MSLSYKRAGSDEIVYGDISKHFLSGSLILLRGSTDHHFINRNAAVYLPAPAPGQVCPWAGPLLFQGLRGASISEAVTKELLRGEDSHSCSAHDSVIPRPTPHPSARY